MTSTSVPKPKTDLEKLTNLLDKFGIEYRTGCSPASQAMYSEVYLDCGTAFYFNKEGKFSDCIYWD